MVKPAKARWTAASARRSAPVESAKTRNARSAARTTFAPVSTSASARTRAERAGDGSYRLSGQKIFITYGEHDMADLEMVAQQTIVELHHVVIAVHRELAAEQFLENALLLGRGGSQRRR